MGREEKEEASKLVILLGREGRLGIGREEGGELLIPLRKVKKRERALIIPKEEAMENRIFAVSSPRQNQFMLL